MKVVNQVGKTDKAVLISLTILFFILVAFQIGKNIRTNSDVLLLTDIFDAFTNEFRLLDYESGTNISLVASITVLNRRLLAPKKLG